MPGAIILRHIFYPVFFIYRKLYDLGTTFEYVNRVPFKFLDFLLVETNRQLFHYNRFARSLRFFFATIKKMQSLIK